MPAGTQLAVELIAPVGTKTNKVGDSVDARLASDLMIGDRRAAKAGASVHGSITQIISGSKKIGGTPTLGVTFDSLVAANGASVSINAPFTQLGKSETGKDTAKIVGGAAAGAIIGHQVSHKDGAVVGGLLGGAAGTAAAKGTGGEVTLDGRTGGDRGHAVLVRGQALTQRLRYIVTCMWVAANRSDPNMSSVPASRLTAMAIRKVELDCGGEFFIGGTALAVMAWQRRLVTPCRC